jgi:hypothetical protein
MNANADLRNVFIICIYSSYIFNFIKIECIRQHYNMDSNIWLQEHICFRISLHIIMINPNQFIQLKYINKRFHAASGELYKFFVRSHFVRISSEPTPLASSCISAQHIIRIIWDGEEKPYLQNKMMFRHQFLRINIERTGSWENHIMIEVGGGKNARFKIINNAFIWQTLDWVSPYCTVIALFMREYFPELFHKIRVRNLWSFEK